MTSRPNSRRDRGFEKLAARLAFVHKQPDAGAANAAITGFHGANPDQLRVRYIHEYAPQFEERSMYVRGQALVDLFMEAWSAAHPDVPRWTGADLRASREALGLSMTELAAWLPWKQSRISEAERGLRRIPDWVPERMSELERRRERLRAAMVDAVRGAPRTPLIVHATDRGYAQAHPSGADLDVPAAVQRVAAGLAASDVERLTGDRPPIVLDA